MKFNLTMKDECVTIMNERMLPFRIPPVISYQVYAYPLGALFTEKSTFEWFFSDFIQLKCISNFIEINDLWFEYHAGSVFGGVSIIDYNVYTKNDITSLLNFIIDRINEDKYIYTFVDKYYFPQYSTYMKTHFIHDALIYGYNQKEFRIAGFNNNSFSTFSISFDDFINAFRVTQYYSMQHFNIVICFKRKQDSLVNFATYINKAIKSLSDYLNSSDSSYQCGLYNVFETHTFNSLESYKCLEEYYNETVIKIRKVRVYGLKTNECLKNYLLSLSGGYSGYDIRPLHVFYEHKKIMAIKLEYLENRFKLMSIEKQLSKYKELSNIALTARNLMLKYDITKQEGLINNIINKIDEIEIEERIIIPELIDILTDLNRKPCICN